MITLTIFSLAICALIVGIIWIFDTSKKQDTDLQQIKGLLLVVISLVLAPIGFISAMIEFSLGIFKG
jgi:uncharacterized membrane protein YsdA (DUF1294 family)